jgi:Tfp pilus assembly protein PilF
VFLLLGRGRRPRGELAVLAACAAVYLLLRWNALGSLLPPPRGTFFRPADLGERLLRAGQMAVRHAGLLVLAESSVPSYRGDPVFAAPPPGLAGAAGLCGVVLLAAWGAARRRILAGALALWAVLAFLPTSHLVSAGDPLAPRFVHAAVFPVGLLLVLAARRLGRAGLALVFALAVALVVPHARSAAVYRDAGTAWEAVLERFPHDAPARLMCALAKEDRNDLAGAAADLRRLALERPDYVRARVNLARILHELGATEEALELLAEADREPQAGDRGALLRGRLLLGLGRFAEADAALALALRRNPRNGQAARYRVRAALAAGDHARAARLLTEARAIDPRHPTLEGLGRKILR